MKTNSVLFVAIIILLFIIAAGSVYCIHQNDNAIAAINQLKSEKVELSKKLDSLQLNLKTKNMAAYVIFIKEKTINQEELKIYAKEAPAGLAGHNIITRAAYGKNQVIEGADVEGVAILEFPSFEEAKTWYENPIYQKAKEHRLKGGVYRAIIVDGINKP
jgi:uncharacterized protein (DUF1330 family)